MPAPTQGSPCRGPTCWCGPISSLRLSTGARWWSQAATVGLWRWSLDWEREDGWKVYYKGGRSPSQAAARWEAQWATQALLDDPHRAKSPMTGDPLITPR